MEREREREREYECSYSVVAILFEAAHLLLLLLLLLLLHEIHRLTHPIAIASISPLPHPFFTSISAPAFLSEKGLDLPIKRQGILTEKKRQEEEEGRRTKNEERRRNGRSPSFSEVSSFPFHIDSFCRF